MEVIVKWMGLKSQGPLEIRAVIGCPKLHTYGTVSELGPLQNELWSRPWMVLILGFHCTLIAL